MIQINMGIPPFDFQYAVSLIALGMICHYWMQIKVDHNLLMSVS